MSERWKPGWHEKEDRSRGRDMDTLGISDHHERYADSGSGCHTNRIEIHGEDLEEMADLRRRIIGTLNAKAADQIDVARALHDTLGDMGMNTTIALKVYHEAASKLLERFDITKKPS